MDHRTDVFSSLRRRAVLWSAASAALLGGLISPGHAATLLQTNTQLDSNGNAYFAWEAEDYDSITVRTAGNITWKDFTDANASGGKALLADDADLSTNNGSGPPSGANSNIVTYKLVFTVPGTYSLYWLGRAGGSADGIGGNVGNNDSLYVPLDFDVNPTRSVNGSGPGDLVRLGGTSASDNYTTSYQWFEQGGTTNARVDFVVTADDVAQGAVLTLSIGAREDGLLIDRWILSANTDLFSSTAGNSAGKLNAFVNSSIVAVPAPAALPAGAMLLAAVVACRRR